MSVIVKVENHVMSIIFDRPDKKNAFTAEMYREINDAIMNASKDPNVQVVYFYGSHDCFSAGNDLADFVANPPDGQNAPVFQLLQNLAKFEKPVVASVSGLAIGIGTTILLHCDLVYCATNAKFSMPFVKLGLCPEAASTLLLPRLVGYPRAAELLLLGDMFSAEDAYQMGLVSKVTSIGDLMPYSMTQINKLLALSPTSLRVTKKLMKHELSAAVSETIAREASLFGRLLEQPEAKEAFAAFFEKRAPDFTQFRKENT